VRIQTKDFDAGAEIAASRTATEDRPRWRALSGYTDATPHGDEDDARTLPAMTERR